MVNPCGNVCERVCLLLLFFFSSNKRGCVTPTLTHGRWRSGRASRHFFAFSTHVDLEKSSGAFCWSFLVFLIYFFFFFCVLLFLSRSHISFSRISLERKRTGARIVGKGRDHPRLLFLRNKIRVVGAWGQAVPFYLRISAEFGRETTTVDILFQSPFPFLLLLFIFFFSLSFSLSLSLSLSVCFFWFARRVLRL